MTNDKIRASVYFVSGIALYALGLVQVWHSIRNGGDIQSAITGIGTLITGSAPSYAGYKTQKQIGDGTLGTTAAEKAIQAVQEVLADHDAAVKAVSVAQDEVKQVADAVQAVKAVLPSPAQAIQNITVNNAEDALRAAQSLADQVRAISRLG